MAGIRSKSGEPDFETLTGGDMISVIDATTGKRGVTTVDELFDVGVALTVSAGTAAAPGLNINDVGGFYSTAGTIYAAIGGTEIFRFTTSGIAGASPFISPAGTAALPGFNVNNVGGFYSTAGKVKVAVGSVETAHFSSSGLSMFGDNVVLSADRLLLARSYTVALLPAAPGTGAVAFATNCRVFDGAGVQEGAGVGTGGLVTHNGTAWKIAGTNVTAVA